MSVQVNTDKNLDFAKADTFYATHRMHSFSAKFPPQLPRWGIEEFTEPGDYLLDPMVGSGTLLVEAMLRGRNSFGIDIDPLSRLIAKVKATCIDPAHLIQKTESLKKQLRAAFTELATVRSDGSEDTIAALYSKYHIDIPDFHNRDYWFLPEVSEELALLKSLLRRVYPPQIREFLCVVFSSIIITKGKTSVANVMDLAHSRPHHVEPEKKPDVLGTFMYKLDRLRDSLIDFSIKCDRTVRARVIGDDAKDVPLPSDSIDLIFTSPPYVNAIDYPRAHKFSIFWIGDFLNISPAEYSQLGREYIGTERVPIKECKERTHKLFHLPELDAIIARLAHLDVKRAGIVHRYFEEMEKSMAEMCRVLRPGKRAVIVVGPSNIKNIRVSTHTLLIQLAERLWDRNGHNLQCEEVIKRNLDDSKRQLPIVRGQFGPGIRTEYVIVLRKSD